MVKSLILAAMLVGLLFPPCITRAQSAGHTIVEWNFDKGSDAQGWVANDNITGVVVGSGMLSADATGPNPCLASPLTDFPATPWQWIVIRMKSDRSGQGRVYWTDTTEQPYDGFRPDEFTPYDVTGDGQWHTIRIHPFWQTVKRIIRLRVDPPPGLQFAISAISVAEPSAPVTPVSAAAWDFTHNVHGWTVSGSDTAPELSGQGIRIDTPGPTTMLSSPPLSLTLGNQTMVAVRMSSTRGAQAVVSWATSSFSGLHRMSFPIRSDGKFHTYNFGVAEDASWTGNLLNLGVSPSDQSRDQVAIRSITLETNPIGEPTLQMQRFAMEDGVNRVGKPCKLSARMTNLGGETASGITAHLTLPRGVTAQTAILRNGRVQADPAGAHPAFEYQVPESFRYLLTAQHPIDGEATIKFSGRGAPPGVFYAPIHITPQPAISSTGYVPEVKPAKTDYQIGMFYFPGWDMPEKWDVINRVTPERKPLLGYYDQFNPECADWQIKWAAEHGISFLLVDWYWSKGQLLDQWVARGLMKARYRNSIKWAVMWANHNPPGSNSVEDWTKVTQYWIDNYFGLANYQRIDGKPAIYIDTPNALRGDMGSEGTAKLIALSQAMAKKAGYPGIEFVAMNSTGLADDAKILASEGYVADTEYHWGDFHITAGGFAIPEAKDPNHVPYSLVVDHSRAAWDQRQKTMQKYGITYFENVETGWDPRPYQRDRDQSYIITDRTPAQFERLLRIAKSYLDEHHQKTLVLGPCNEWGEGSYTEPCTEYGFRMYDAVRRVFCDEPETHVDVAPVDVGRGPYGPDEPPSWYRTQWAFNHAVDSQGWFAIRGMAGVDIKDGYWHDVSATDDAAFDGPIMDLRAAEYPSLTFKMKLSPVPGNKDSMQVFWLGSGSAVTSDDASVRVDTIPDGRFHTYVLPMGQNPRWRGIIKMLTVVPCKTPGVDISIAEIRFAKAKP